MSDLGIKIYSDGADADEIIKMDADNLVDGFTTNPTLMKKAGVTSEQVPEHVTNALTRDYSDLMKAINNKGK